MAQDIRNLFEEESNNQHIKMPEGHDIRFLQKLKTELSNQKSFSRFKRLNIAASIVILLGLSYGVFKYWASETMLPVDKVKNVVETDIKTLGDYSPELRKVEDYYLASINLELSKVQLTPQSKELFDGYIQRLKELNEEYNKLTIELNESGPNEDTLDALIDNLKFRLDLVMRLKEKLKEFNGEPFNENNI